MNIILKVCKKEIIPNPKLITYPDYIEEYIKELEETLKTYNSIPKYLLNVSPKRTFFRILLVIVLSVLLYLPFIFNTLFVENIFEWCLYAILVMIYAIIVTVLIMFIFNSKTFKQIFKRIMGVIQNR